MARARLTRSHQARVVAILELNRPLKRAALLFLVYSIKPEQNALRGVHDRLTALAPRAAQLTAWAMDLNQGTAAAKS